MIPVTLNLKSTVKYMNTVLNIFQQISQNKTNPVTTAGRASTHSDQVRILVKRSVS